MPTILPRDPNQGQWEDILGNTLEGVGNVAGKAIGISTKERMWKKAGYDQDTARILARLEPNEAVKFAGAISERQGQRQAQPQQPQQQPQDLMQSLGMGQQQQQGNPLMNALLNPQAGGMDLNPGLDFSQLGAQVMPQQEMAPEQQIQQMIQQQMQGQPEESLRDILARPSAKQQKAQQEAQFKTSAEGRDKAKFVREFSAPYRSKRAASEANIRDYDQLIKLADSGNLRAGNTNQLLGKIGFEGFNRNITTQLAEKMIARLGQNAQSAFGTGSRITNYLEQTFQRSLPSLWNTAGGLKVIAQINKLSDEANVIKDDIRKELIRQTNGDIPYDAEDIIEETARPAIEKLEQRALELAQKAAEPQPKSARSSSGGLGFRPVVEVTEQEPNAWEYPGKDMRKPDGKIYTSVAGKWVPKG